ncbi:MAG: VWA domain-containing protein [Gammaproteobacteria bacterium]|nr:MAG: VWA domain-containing protein [Gammaproteobacteria bacterium]
MTSFPHDLPDLPGIHFLRPLWFLALVPLPWLLWRLSRVNPGASAWRGLVDEHLLRHLLVRRGVRVGPLPLILLALGWLLGVTALAGPAWERLPQPLYQTQVQRVIVLDLSPAMDAQDLAPSRLARARYEILDLLAQAAEGQTALLAYGAEPFLVSPLTSDAATIAAQVPDLATALLPVQGPKRTDLALAEAGALLARAGSPEGDIILLTPDAEPLEEARAEAASLRDRGYRTSVLGIGTEKGAPVPRAEGGFQSDAQGAIRLSRLQPAPLKAVAAAGGGHYVALAADDGDTRALLPAGVPEGARTEREKDARADQWREEGPWLLLALLPLAALAFRRGWLSPLALLILGMCLGPSPPAVAWDWEDLWWRPDQQGAHALAAGDPQGAARRFDRPDWRAAAQYQAGDYEQASDTLKEQMGPEAAYNRGNALARTNRLEEALAEYDRTLKEVPEHADARHNRDLVQRLLDQRRTGSQSAAGDNQGGDGAQSEPREGDGQAGQNEDAARDQRSGGEGQGQQPSSSSGQGQEGPRPSPTSGLGQDGQQPPPSSGGVSAGGQTPESSGQVPEGGRPPESSGQAPEGGLTPESEVHGAADQPPEPVEGQSQGGHPATEPGRRDLLGGGKAGRQVTPQAVPPATPEDTSPAAPPSSPETDSGSASESSADSASAGEGPKGQREANTSGGPPGQNEPRHLTEAQQALEQQLRRVPDDPGGLLRQRFLLQHLRRQGQLP